MEDKLKFLKNLETSCTLFENDIITETGEYLSLWKRFWDFCWKKKHHTDFENLCKNLKEITNEDITTYTSQKTDDKYYSERKKKIKIIKYMYKIRVYKKQNCCKK